jgi:Flp pilus assembly protein TadG
MGDYAQVLKSQKGAVAVEFALVLPLLLLLVFGVLEFGLIMSAKGVITHASREGARLGVVYCNPRKTPAEITACVQAYLNTAGIYDATINVTPGASSGDLLTVKVAYTYQFMVLPRLVESLTGELNLTAETVMRME